MYTCVRWGPGSGLAQKKITPYPDFFIRSSVFLPICKPKPSPPLLCSKFVIRRMEGRLDLLWRFGLGTEWSCPPKRS